MEEIRAFKTTDGFIFEDRETARQREQDLQIQNALYGFVEKYGCYEMTKDNVKDILYENREELMKILRGLEE